MTRAAACSSHGNLDIFCCRWKLYITLATMEGNGIFVYPSKSKSQESAWVAKTVLKLFFFYSNRQFLRVAAHTSCSSPTRHARSRYSVLIAQTMSCSGISKRRRKQRSMSKPMTVFFDKLPRRAILHILKFFSKKPRNVGWIAHVPPNTMLTLLNSGKALRRGAREAFCRLANSRFGSPKDGAVRVFEHGELDKSLMYRLTSKIGKGLNDLYYWAALPSPITLAIADDCSNLRSFSFRPAQVWRLPTNNIYAIIVARGHALETLCIEDFDAASLVVSAIAQYCQRLRTLKLDCLEVWKSFAFIWKSVAGSLKHLDLKSATE